MRLITASALGAFAGALILAACSSAAGPVDLAENASAAPPRVCAAEQYQILVGELAGEVDTATLPQPVRLLGMEDEVSPTPDPARLTLTTGGDGRISSVVCN